MSPKPYPFGNANLSTCEWFVPELARWASQLKLDDDNAPTSLPTGPHPRLILTAQDIARIRTFDGELPAGESITYDVNRAWLPDEAVRVMNAVRGVDAYFEQPCETFEECLKWPCVSVPPLPAGHFGQCPAVAPAVPCAPTVV